MNNKVSIKNDSFGKYLIVPAPETEDKFEAEMIESLTGKNMLKPIYVYENERKCCSYNVSTYISFGDYMAVTTFRYADIQAIMIQINNAIRCMLDYLLGEENLLLGEDSIFVDKESKTLKFCAYPGDGSKFSRGLVGLLGKMLMHTDINDIDAIILCVRMYRASSESGSRIYDVINAMMSRKESTNVNTSPKVSTLPESTTWSKSTVNSRVSPASKAQSGPKAQPMPKPSSLVRNKSAARVNSIPKPKDQADVVPEQEEDETDSDINILDLDDMELDDYEDEEEDLKSGTGAGIALWLQLLISEGILTLVLAVYILLRGFSIRILELYGVLAICLGLYFIFQHISNKKKQSSQPEQLA